ncbi:TPA: hypothetical protein DCZ81_03865 [Candidatus Collierbacteria bacterium]|uniref:HicB-like antitoxin of toxin-antitoxin system domain-containing protein n=1 Tax=Candidatus Amesbacteria bacterium GW2011_GWC2_47_8 TaxID=1618367 RepID=A0A0G1W388_9BACT|nr:MAG: hypothetical protein UX42_C0023G0005 [Microgenomates group bacterium GW2011_GWC1_46_20]KKU84858.1 MAG: hypothetical protein UY11_C0002G0013 [Candidatus Amesbacteria bacterium GW2011_GWC2_47_8]HBC45277.1 hypothetical protein [Candidatus Collierbacteria bacterium]
MQKRVLNYSVIIKLDSRTGTNQKCYSAYCPTLDVYSEGDTVEKAQKNIKAAIELASEVAAENNSEFPIEKEPVILTQVRLAF